MSMLRVGRVGVMAAALALLATSCSEGQQGSGGASGQTNEFTLVVGDLLPMTGAHGPYTASARKAADLAIVEAVASLKRVGASEIAVQLSHADTQSSPQSAVSGARKLLAEGATCLSIAASSAETIPVAQSVAIRHRVPHIAASATSAEITSLKDDDYVFRTVPADTLQGEALANVVAAELGGARGKTLSLAARNDAYGAGFIRRVEETWKGLGGKAKRPLLYDPRAANYDSEAATIVADDPDAYVIVDLPDTYAKLGAALLRTGKFDARKLFTADGLTSSTIPQGVPAHALEGARGTRPGTSEDSAAAKAFDTLFKGSSGIKERGSFDAQNFDAAMLCVLAAVAAGSSDAAEIKAQIRAVSAAPGKPYTFEQLDAAIKDLLAGKEIDYEGVSGPLNLDANGDPSSALYDLWTYRGGRLSIVRQFDVTKG